MEQNSTLINCEDLKEFVISNKIRIMKRNIKQKKEKNSCTQEFEDKR